MKIILDKHDGHHRSMVAIQENAITAADVLWAREYLDRIQDFRGGMTSWGKAIPRLQRWYGSGYFGAHWKDQDNERWKPCKYEDELVVIQDIMQERFDKCVVAKELGLVGATKKTHNRRRCCFGRHCHFKMRNCRKQFNSCLLNKYRSGEDSIKPHRDSEEIFGENPIVVILSVGATRTLTFRRIIYDEDNLHLVQPETDPGLADEFSVEMKEGSMLVMAGALQKYYSHEITKVDDGGDDGGDDGVTDDENTWCRYSLTFRNFGND